MIDTTNFGVGTTGVAAPPVVVDTIYTADGQTTDNRVVDSNGYAISFIKATQFNIFTDAPPPASPSIVLKQSGTMVGEIGVSIENGAGLPALRTYGDRTTRMFSNVAINDSVTSTQIFRSYTADGGLIAGVFQNDGVNGTAVNAFAPGAGGRAFFANASGVNSTGMQATATIGCDGITMSTNGFGTRGIVESNSSLGAVALAGLSRDTIGAFSDMNYAGLFSGVVEHRAYEKASLPTLPNISLCRGIILVVDAGVTNDQVALCVYNGTDWINIVTNLPIV